MSFLLRNRFAPFRCVYFIKLPTHIRKIGTLSNCQSTVFDNNQGLQKSHKNYWNAIDLRHKSKNRKADRDDDEDERHHFDEDASLSRDSKVVKFSTTSMRTDGILKSALGTSRNKIEKYFYDSRLRVNGRKILKKSTAVREGDEIDLIKAISPKNPDHLQIARVEILSVVPKEESISVTARRFKNLLIENYEQDPFKGTIEADGLN